MRARLSPTLSPRLRQAALPAMATLFRALAAGLFALFVAAGPGAPHAAAVGYTVTDLGMAWTWNPMAMNISSMAMNHSGQVAGPLPPVPNTQGDWDLFLDDAAGMHDLGQPVAAPGGIWLPAFIRTRGVNDAGQIVGDAELVADGPGPTHAFLYDGTVHDLGSPIDGDSSSAAAINDAGHVAVVVWDPHQINIPDDARVYHAFLYDGTGLHDLGMPPGYTWIRPVAINASDEIVGSMGSSTGQRSSFLWRNGTLLDLGTLDGGGPIFVDGINDAGQIVGQAGATQEAVLYDAGGVHHLGGLGGGSSEAMAINNRGQIAGVSGTADAQQHLFLYTAGTMEDVTERLLGPDPFPDQVAAISDDGKILFYGRENGASFDHGYLLTPTPAPLLRASASRLDLGSQPVGTTSAAQTLTLTNDGELPVSIGGVSLAGSPAFAIAGDSGETTLAPGASRTIRITFSPTFRNTVSATLSIQSSDPRPAAPRQVTLTGTGTASAITLGASSVSFGSQRVGTTSAAQPLTVTNSGAAPLLLQGASIAGANASEFTVSDVTGASVAPGQSLTINLFFAPAARGSRSASLSLQSNAPGAPVVSIALTGTGIAPVLHLNPAALPFGPQPVGLGRDLALLLQNRGDAPLTVSSLAIQGANAGDFSVATDGVSGQTLQPGDIVLLNIGFTPTATGSRSATLLITDDAADNPQSVALTGTGTAPLLALSADSLIFGLQAPGSTQTLTLTNNGDAPLTIASVDRAGPNAASFQIVSDSGEKTLDPGASRTLTIAFSPASTAGARRARITAAARIADTSYVATLEIHDNDPHPDAPHTVTLTASGSGTPAGAGSASGGTPPSGGSTSGGTAADTNPPAPPGSGTPASGAAAPGATVPGTPTNLTLTGASAREIDLTWTPGGGDVTGLSLFRQAGGGAWDRIAVLAPSATHWADRSVQPGTTYAYQLRAHNSQLVSAWSNQVSTALTAPAAPAGLTAAPAGPQVILTWTSHSNNETAFAIWRQTAGGAFTRVGVVPPHTTSFRDRTVAPGTAYTYEVRAINNLGASAWSNPAPVTTLEAPPAAPMNLTATLAAGEIDLTWTAGGGNATGIAIFRQTSGGAWVRIGVVSPSTTHYADRSAQPGTRYGYQVRAHNNTQVSAWSNPVTVVTPAAP